MLAPEMAVSMVSFTVNSETGFQVAGGIGIPLSDRYDRGPRLSSRAKSTGFLPALTSGVRGVGEFSLRHHRMSSLADALQATRWGLPLRSSLA
jgi:hypothetical protein